METLLMRGKPIADAYKQKLAKKVLDTKQNRNIVANLVTVLVGEDPASKVYRNTLVKLIKELGGTSTEIELPEDTTQEKVVASIRKLNRNRYATGVLPLMPMPKHLDGTAASSIVAMNKDIDCLNSVNKGEFFAGDNPWAPATPRACMAILEHYGIEVEGKHAVVLGRSNVVGKAAAMLLLQKNATVTICHSKTQNLADFTRQADIIIAAVGKPCFVTPDMVKEGVVIVDVGINSVDGKLVGDVDPAVAEKAAAFTPVPGGVGVVSNVMVMEALLRHL